MNYETNTGNFGKGLIFVMLAMTLFFSSSAFFSTLNQPQTIDANIDFSELATKQDLVLLYNLQLQQNYFLKNCVFVDLNYVFVNDRLFHNYQALCTLTNNEIQQLGEGLE